MYYQAYKVTFAYALVTLTDCEKFCRHAIARNLAVALEWERAFGSAPQVTTVLSEYDAARLVVHPIDSYSLAMQDPTAVQQGYDFLFNGARYQIKGTRPSGKRGSFVTNVPQARNYDWDDLIWVSYDTQYNIQEAWQ